MPNLPIAILNLIVPGRVFSPRDNGGYVFSVHEVNDKSVSIGPVFVSIAQTLSESWCDDPTAVIKGEYLCLTEDDHLQELSIQAQIEFDTYYSISIQGDVSNDTVLRLSRGLEYALWILVGQSDIEVDVCFQKLTSDDTKMVTEIVDAIRPELTNKQRNLNYHYWSFHRNQQLFPLAGNVEKPDQNIREDRTFHVTGRVKAINTDPKTMRLAELDWLDNPDVSSSLSVPYLELDIIGDLDRRWPVGIRHTFNIKRLFEGEKARFVLLSLAPLEEDMPENFMLT